jgi:competence protein ComEC
VFVAGDRTNVRAGQGVEAAGQLARVARPLNPGEFDYRAFLQAQGIRLRLTVDTAEGLWRDPGASESAIMSWLKNRPAWSRAKLEEHIDPAVAPLAAALLLGQREGIEPEVNDAFARTGTTHLLAISGLQLQALAAALLLVFRVIGIPRRPAYLAVALATISYAMLVGLAPSVVRSALMTATFCLAAIVERVARPANTLALAALGTLGLNPMFLFDTGCQLSFLAIGALIWLVPPACALWRHCYETIRGRVFGPRSQLDDLERRFEPRWRTALRKVGMAGADGVVASTVVWLAALPLVAWRFHLVSPIGIVLNIPLIPLTTAALLLGGLGLGLSAVWGPLAAPPAWAAAWLLKLTEAIVRSGVAMPWGHRFAVGPDWGWVLAFYVLLGLATLATTAALRLPQSSRSRWFRCSLAWLLLAGWILPAWLAPKMSERATVPEAEILAVGHGLAAMIRTPGGQTFLYDCGRLRDPSVGRRIIAPALWARGVARIDTVFLSHADADHYDGLPDLLDRFAIGAVRAPPGFEGPANPRAMQLIQQVRARGIPVKPIAAPDAWEEDGVRFTVHHPRADWHPETSDNARSLVLDVAFAGRHMFLTGDLEQLGLVELVGKPAPDPPPDVFLAPHHGGRSANPEWLYRWAKPRVVAVSQRALPATARDALAPLERDGVQLLRTWRRGAIRLRWTEDGIIAGGFLEETTRQPFRCSQGTLRLLAGLLGFALGAMTCAFLAVVEFGAWALVVPPRLIKEKTDQSVGKSAREADDLIEPITVRARDGALLAGRWFSASGARGAGRIVVLLHGFAEDSAAWAERRAQVLNQHGWNVAALDSRGCGQSGGPYASFGGREAGDLRLWLDALAERTNGADRSSAFEPVVWGRSMGALIALKAAALDQRFAALVLESPLVDLGAAVAGSLRRRRCLFPGLLAHLIISRGSKLAGVALDRPRPIELAPVVTRATLIVHGTDDEVVPFADARRLADAFASPPRWLDVAGAGHSDVIEMGGDELLHQVAAFLDEATSGAEPNRCNTQRES